MPTPPRPHRTLAEQIGLVRNPMDDYVSMFDALNGRLREVLPPIAPQLIPTLQSLLDVVRRPVPFLDEVRTRYPWYDDWSKYRWAHNREILAKVEEWPADKRERELEKLRREGEAALHGLARRIAPGWKVFGQAKLVLREHERLGTMSYAELKHHALCIGIGLVHAELARPQSHRFGHKWAKHRGSRRKAVFVPDRLPIRHMGLTWEWFKDEAMKAATSVLVGQDYPLGQADKRRDDPALSAPIGNRAAQYAADNAADVAALLDRQDEAIGLLGLLELTPAERELLAVIQEQFRHYPDRRKPNIAEAARALSIKPVAARVRWHRLKRRLQPAM